MKMEETGKVVPGGPESGPLGPDHEAGGVSPELEEAADMGSLDGCPPRIREGLDPLTQDDVDRVRAMAGELEGSSREVRRQLDQDGRESRYLRLLAERIRAEMR